MKHIPPHLARYLLSTALSAADPAWLILDHDAKIQSFGGSLDALNLGSITIGDKAELAAPFLAGLIPLGGRSLILPLVDTGEGRVVDVHLVADQAGDSVLLLDATSEAQHRRELQQEAYRGLLETRTPDALINSAAASAGWLFFVRERGSDSFVQKGERPGWAKSFSVDTGLPVQEIFPFLEAFLPEAEHFFDAGEPGRGPLSGLWMEDEGQLPLEAQALLTEQGDAVIMVEALGAAYEERQALMQRAREHALSYESLRREVDRKEVLLHCIVHDLKSPLTSLTTSLWLLASGKLNADEMKQTAQVGLDQGKRQERMIMTILEVFSDEQSDAAPSEATVDLLACAEEEMEALRPSFLRRDLRLQLHHDGDVDTSFVAAGDWSRMGRVIANLLENALRHTSEGGMVLVSLGRSGEHITVSVENEGNAVPPALRSRLFKRFTQGNSGGAVGLGLFYCRITVEKWGGGIAYEPRVGGGSRFHFWLPAASTDKA